MVLSATIMLNVLEYIYESLYLGMPVYLYKQTLDQPNITYIVKKIKQKGFKELDVLASQTKGILGIPKTMIFVNKIEDGIKII